MESVTESAPNGTRSLCRRERKCLSVDRKNLWKRFRNRAAFAVILLLIFQVPLYGYHSDRKEVGDDGTDLSGTMLHELADSAKKSLYQTFMPSLCFSMESDHKTWWLIQQQIESVLPFYGYMTEGMEIRDSNAGAVFREILLEEAREGSSFREELTEDPYFWEDEDQHADDSTLAELLQAENEAAWQMQQSLMGGSQGFVPHVQQAQIDLEALKDYETFVREFYIIDANTMAGSSQLDVEKLSAKDLAIEKNSNGPQILIYHTHSQEGFADSIAGDDTTNIQGVGERLAWILRDTYGYQVLHHTGEYDVETRDDAYARSLPEISRILDENPTIQVVIDLHRDEVPENTRLVMDLDGRPTARFMFFNGLSRTKTTGDIAYLYNENLEDNLAFSFQMQRKAMEYYPGLTRKIYLKGYRYNMHLASRYLLIELGAQNNTLEEAMNACDPLAHILNMVLSGE